MSGRNSAGVYLERYTTIFRSRLLLKHKTKRERERKRSTQKGSRKARQTLISISYRIVKLIAASGRSGLAVMLTVCYYWRSLSGIEH